MSDRAAVKTPSRLVTHLVAETESPHLQSIEALVSSMRVRTPRDQRPWGDPKCAPTGLHVSTVGGSGEDAGILELTFPDPNRIISDFRGRTLQLTGVLARMLST